MFQDAFVFVSFLKIDSVNLFVQRLVDDLIFGEGYFFGGYNQGPLVNFWSGNQKNIELVDPTIPGRGLVL